MSDKINTPPWVPSGGMLDVSLSCYNGLHCDMPDGCARTQETCICPCHDPDAVPVEEVR